MQRRPPPQLCEDTAEHLRELQRRKWEAMENSGTAAAAGMPPPPNGRGGRGGRNGGGQGGGHGGRSKSNLAREALDACWRKVRRLSDAVSGFAVSVDEMMQHEHGLPHAAAAAHLAPPPSYPYHHYHHLPPFAAGGPHNKPQRHVTEASMRVDLSETQFF